MAFESLKRIVYDFLRCFSIEVSSENQGPLLFSESLVAQRADIGPEGSSVDPEPVETASKAASTDLNVTRARLEDSRASEGSSESGQESDEDTRITACAAGLPKAAPCTDALSQNLFTAVGNDSATDECSETVFSECERESETEEVVKCPQANVLSAQTSLYMPSQCNEQVSSAVSICIETEKEIVESEGGGHSDVKDTDTIKQVIDADSEPLVPAIPSTDYLGSQCSDAQEECEQASDKEVYNADNTLPKSPLSSKALSQDIITAVRQDSVKDEYSETVFSEESERETETEELIKRPQQSITSDQTSEDATSQCTEQNDSAEYTETEKKAVENEGDVYSDVKGATKQDDAESELLVPAIPSTDYFGSRCTDAQEECILHRIIPKLSATRGNCAARKPQQTSGKVTFNSPLFSEGDFELRIIHEKVCLEFVQIDANEIHGYVRVLNTTYVKDVTVYYTKNKWKIVRSRKAKWVETVSDGTMDRFVFTIPGRQSVGNLLFSVEFNGTLDNNKGHYYTVAYEAA